MHKNYFPKRDSIKFLQKIAKESKCNEVTIFRIFKTKRGLLEAILNKFVEESKIIELLSKNLTGDLDSDIKKVF